MKIKTQYNRSEFPPMMERKTTLPSKTEPNMAMSIEEIMRRFASGLPVTGAKVPLYDFEGNPDEIIDLPYFGDPKAMDLADLQESADMALDFVKRTRRQQEADKKAEEEKRYKAWKEQFRNEQQGPKAPAPPSNIREIPPSGGAAGGEQH